MNRIGLLFSLLVLIWFWTRLLRQVFSPLTKIKISKIWLLFRGGVLVMIFLGYQRLIQEFGNRFSIPSIKDQFSPIAVFVFWIYCTTIALILPPSFSLSKNKKIWLQITIGIASFLFFFLSGNPRSLGTLFLLAYSEEFFKFSVAHLHSEKSDSESASKLLLYSLLIGLSFSIAENILAIIIQIFTTSELSAILLLQRGFLTSSIHVFATWSTALILLKTRSKSLLINLLLANTVGFLIHSLYNFGYQNEQIWISLLLATTSLIGGSYLFFHLDELYLSDKNKQHLPKTSQN